MTPKKALTILFFLTIASVMILAGLFYLDSKKKAKDLTIPSPLITEPAIPKIQPATREQLIKKMEELSPSTTPLTREESDARKEALRKRMEELAIPISVIPTATSAATSASVAPIYLPDYETVDKEHDSKTSVLLEKMKELEN